MPIRVGLIGVGFWASKTTLRFGLNSIETFLGRGKEERVYRSRWLCWGPYLIGGICFTLAGLLNPQGRVFAITSALATFGGTAFLALLPTRLKGPPEGTPEAAVTIERSVPWLVVGTASILFLFLILGPSIRFATPLGSE